MDDVFVDLVLGLLRHPRVFWVVADFVLGGQPIGAVRQGQHERGNTHCDHDRGQDHALRQWVGDTGSPAAGAAADRRVSGRPGYGQNQQVERIANEQDSQQHSSHTAFEEQIHAGAREHADQEQWNKGGGHRPASSTSRRAPRLRSTSSTSPTTMRYTPRSKNSAVTNLTWPSTGRSTSINADDSTGAPSRSDTAAVPADNPSPTPSIL